MCVVPEEFPLAAPELPPPAGQCTVPDRQSPVNFERLELPPDGDFRSDYSKVKVRRLRPI